MREQFEWLELPRNGIETAHGLGWANVNKRIERACELFKIPYPKKIMWKRKRRGRLCLYPSGVCYTQTGVIKIGRGCSDRKQVLTTLAHELAHMKHPHHKKIHAELTVAVCKLWRIGRAVWQRELRP